MLERLHETVSHFSGCASITCTEHSVESRQFSADCKMSQVRVCRLGQPGYAPSAPKTLAKLLPYVQTLAARQTCDRQCGRLHEQCAKCTRNTYELALNEADLCAILD